MKVNQIMQWIVVAIMSCCLASCASDSIKSSSKATSIAILMPLTGASGPVGQRIASMVELGVDDALEGNVKLMTYDIAEESRIPVVIKKMRSRGTSVVLGPIFSSSSSVIIPQIKPYGMIMITLSNNPTLASDGVYVFGHAPVKQTERIIEYTLLGGYKDYITLLPANQYSREMISIIGNQVSSYGGKIVRSEFYSDRNESIESAVKNVASIVDNINELDDAATKPVLYISDNDPITLSNIFDMIKKYNLDITTTIVGDNKLDIEYANPITYLFTGAMNAKTRQITSKARDVFGFSHLNYMDLLAYDLGNITAHAIGKDLTKEGLVAKLNYGHLYNGSSGNVKFISGVADRKYDIIKRDGVNYSLIDVAK